MTPNSPTAPNHDIHADPLFRQQFEHGAGQQISGSSALDTVPLRHNRRLPCNVGRTEQQLRLIAGSAMLTAAAVAPVSRGWRVALGALGAMEIATGSTRYCPLWQAFGINTNRHERSSA